MKRKLLTGVCVVMFGVSGMAYSDDTTVTLDGNTSSSGFSIKDSSGTSIARFQGDGKVGIGTTSPADKLDVSGRIVSTNATNDNNRHLTFSGYSGNTWDIFGGHGGGGYFGIAENAGDPAFVVQATDGKVGIGTKFPNSQFTVRAAEDNNTIVANFYGGNAAGVLPTISRGLYISINFSGGYAETDIWNSFDPSTYTGTGIRFLQMLTESTYRDLMFLSNTGNVGIGTISPSYPLHMASGAYCSSSGVWTNASSRDYKENIKELSAKDAMDAFEKLTPVIFNYKVDTSDNHVGFIAEDVPDMIATPDHKGLSPMDITAVLTKVVQEQQKQIQYLKEEIASLKKTEVKSSNL